MKLLKLPVCPHCHAVYRYDEVKNMCRYRHIECRHCKKIFTVESRKGKIIYFTIDSILLITMNIILFHFAEIHPLGLILFTLVFFGLSLLLVPFTVRFSVYDGYREKQRKKKSQGRKNKQN